MRVLYVAGSECAPLVRTQRGGGDVCGACMSLNHALMNARVYSLLDLVGIFFSYNFMYEYLWVLNSTCPLPTIHNQSRFL